MNANIFMCGRETWALKFELIKMHNARGVEVVECSIPTELQCNYSQNELYQSIRKKKEKIDLNDLSFFGLENSE